MDVDKPMVKLERRASDIHVNAEAGPSTLPEIPTVFLPPPSTSISKPLLHSTQDLLSRFKLLSSYDKYVRPHVQSVNNAATPGTMDKGKARDLSAVTPPAPAGASTPMAGDGGDGDEAEEEGGKGDKKQKNSYRHLIKGIPGKHSTKKDDYLETMMLQPPKQHIPIRTLDLDTEAEGFSVSLEGLKGWNTKVLMETAQDREARKKKKELKKLMAAQSGAQTPAPATTTMISSAPTPSAAATPGFRPPQTPASMGAGTPRPQGPGPGPPSHAPGRPGTPSQSQNVMVNGTPMPRPGVKKRELEEDSGGVPSVNGAPVAGTGTGQGIQKRAPPGSGGVKSAMPRPQKRQRTDGPSHPIGLNGIPQQQPTPQGV